MRRQEWMFDDHDERQVNSWDTRGRGSLLDVFGKKEKTGLGRFKRITEEVSEENVTPPNVSLAPQQPYPILQASQQKSRPAPLHASNWEQPAHVAGLGGRGLQSPPLLVPDDAMAAPAAAAFGSDGYGYATGGSASIGGHGSLHSVGSHVGNAPAGAPSFSQRQIIPRFVVSNSSPQPVSQYYQQTPPLLQQQHAQQQHAGAMGATPSVVNNAASSSPPPHALATWEEQELLLQLQQLRERRRQAELQGSFFGDSMVKPSSLVRHHQQLQQSSQAAAAAAPALGTSGNAVPPGMFEGPVCHVCAQQHGLPLVRAGGAVAFAASPKRQAARQVPASPSPVSSQRRSAATSPLPISSIQQQQRYQSPPPLPTQFQFLSQAKKNELDTAQRLGRLAAGDGDNNNNGHHHNPRQLPKIRMTRGMTLLKNNNAKKQQLSQPLWRK